MCVGTFSGVTSAGMVISSARRGTWPITHRPIGQTLSSNIVAQAWTWQSSFAPAIKDTTTMTAFEAYKDVKRSLTTLRTSAQLTSSGNSSPTKDMMRDVFPTLAGGKKEWKPTMTWTDWRSFVTWIQYKKWWVIDQLSKRFTSSYGDHSAQIIL